jgi:predicted small secreted protein
MDHRNKAHRISRRIALAATLLATLALSGCNANVGVGMNVSVPVGNNGQMSLSTGRWL